MTKRRHFEMNTPSLESEFRAHLAKAKADVEAWARFFSDANLEIIQASHGRLIEYSISNLVFEFPDLHLTNQAIGKLSVRPLGLCFYRDWWNPFKACEVPLSWFASGSGSKHTVTFGFRETTFLSASCFKLTSRAARYDILAKLVCKHPAMRTPYEKSEHFPTGTPKPKMLQAMIHDLICREYSDRRLVLSDDPMTDALLERQIFDRFDPLTWEI